MLNDESEHSGRSLGSSTLAAHDDPVNRSFTLGDLQMPFHARSEIGLDIAREPHGLPPGGAIVRQFRSDIVTEGALAVDMEEIPPRHHRRMMGKQDGF